MSAAITAYAIIGAIFMVRYYLVGIKGYRLGLVTLPEALLTPISIGLCWPAYLVHRALWP